MIDVGGIIFLGLVAFATVYCGCTMAPNKDVLEEQETIEVTWSQAILFPLTASCVLLLMFYCFSSLQYILLAILVLGSSSAVYDILFRLGNHYLKGDDEIAIKCTAAIISVIILVEWIFFGNWFAHDILGVSLSLWFINSMKFPNLKVATTCMMLLFLYDMFWVFGSQHVTAFEGKSVMVEVATKQASNPINEIGQAIGSSWLEEITQKHIELPIKLLYPVILMAESGESVITYMMLGLGDIALPGLLVSLSLQFDREHGDALDAIGESLTGMEKGNVIKERTLGRDAPLHLFQFALIGYACGLVCAFLCSLVFASAQPALIYIVPSILVPLVSRAYYCGVLGELWQGIKRDKD